VPAALLLAPAPEATEEESPDVGELGITPNTGPDFIGAEEFTGAREGYCFKKDHFGLGYYVDRPAAKLMTEEAAVTAAKPAAVGTGHQSHFSASTFPAAPEPSAVATAQPTSLASICRQPRLLHHVWELVTPCDVVNIVCTSLFGGEAVCARAGSDRSLHLERRPSKGGDHRASEGTFGRVLMLVRFSTRAVSITNTTRYVPQKVLTLSWKVEECKPLLPGAVDAERATLSFGSKGGDPDPHRFTLEVPPINGGCVDEVNEGAGTTFVMSLRLFAAVDADRWQGGH